MRPTTFAVSQSYLSTAFGRSSSYRSKLACVVALSLLGAASGCKKKAPPVEEQTAVPAPVSAPAVVPQPVPASQLPDWKPVSATTSTMEIPKVVGLLVDSTISSAKGDLENFDKVVDMNATTVTMEADDEVAPPTPDGHPVDLNGPPPGIGKGTTLIDVADLASSHRVFAYFSSKKITHHPGTLERGVSTDTLSQLRAGNVVSWEIAIDFGHLILAAESGKKLPTSTDWDDDSTKLIQCKLQRVEPTDLAFPVLVNGEPVELPTLHAKCVMDNGQEDHFYILDQLSNPIFVWTKTAISGDSSQTIKITFVPPSVPPMAAMKAGELPGGGGAGSGKSMEAKLAEKEPVEIYGIYFDFNSAVIKPESEVVLKQISDVMHKNPAWKLSVAGHTDNIGGDDFNQKLSEARSAAVKKALVTEYKIAPERLTTSGFGASRPIADNAKVEGRARNRRVELQRQ
jgi:outer membrane protein OmpA-like peptidoglycan-associated protein